MTGLAAWGGTDALDAGEGWKALYLHEMAAVSEGLCPAHGTPLEPLAGAAARLIAGHCAACRKYWGASLDSEEVGWQLDYDPCTGRPAVPGPGFPAWREDP